MGNIQRGASRESKEKIAAKMAAKRSSETEVEVLRRQLEESEVRRSQADARAARLQEERDGFSARAARSDARAARLQEERDGLQKERDNVFAPLGRALQFSIFSDTGDIDFATACRRTKSTRVTGMSSLAKENDAVRMMIPADVLPWESFDADMSLETNARLSEPEVHTILFEPSKPPEPDRHQSYLSSEAALSNTFLNRVLTPLCDSAGLDNVVLLAEAADGTGHRADFDWLVQDSVDDPRKSLGRGFAGAYIEAKKEEARAPSLGKASLTGRKMTLALRHEHKASGVFPIDPAKKWENKVHVYSLPLFWNKVRERAPARLPDAWVAAKKEEEKNKKKTAKKTKARDGDGDGDGDGDVSIEEASWNVVAEVAYPICQIFTYMVDKKIRFGVLSTTVATWFLKWDGKGNLYASSPRQALHDGLESAKLAYYSVLKRLVDEPSLAVADDVVEGTAWYEREFSQRVADANALKTMVGKDVAPPPAPVGGRGWRFPKNKGGAKGGGGDKAKPFPATRRSLPLPGLGSDGDLEVFAVGRLARVARRVAHGEDMVVKTRMWYENEEADEEAIESFEREMDALERLAELEGTAIPRVLHMGPYGMADIIVTSYEGEALERAFPGGDGNAIPEWARESAREALRAVHEKGVLHRDVALRNFVVDVERRRVKVIDFGRAEMASGYDDSTKRYEEQRLEHLLKLGFDDM